MPPSRARPRPAGAVFAGGSSPCRCRRKKASCKASIPPRQCRWVQPPITRPGWPPAAWARSHRSSTPRRWGSCQPPTSSIGRRNSSGATSWCIHPCGSAASRRSQPRPMPAGSNRSSRGGPSSRKVPLSRLRRICRQPLASLRRRQPSAASCSAQPSPSPHQWAPPSLAQWSRSSSPAMAGARQSGNGSSRCSVSPMARASASVLASVHPSSSLARSNWVRPW